MGEYSDIKPTIKDQFGDPAFYRKPIKEIEVSQCLLFSFTYE